MKYSTNNTIQAFWVALGNLSAFGLAILSAVILSRFLNKEQYGTYKQIIFVYTTLLVIFTAGLPQVFAYFLPRYKVEEGKSIVKKVNLVLFACGLIFSISLYIFSDFLALLLNNEKLIKGLRIFSVVPVFLLPTLGIEGIFSTYKKTFYIAIYNTITRAIMLCFIVVPVIVYKNDYIYALYGWIAASIVTLIIALFFKSIPFKKVEKMEADLKFRQIFRYSLPLVGASIWGIAIKSADTFYISRYFQEETYAEYSNGFISLPFVTMVTSSVAIVLMPIFSNYLYNNESKTKVLELWRTTLNKSVIIIYPLLVYFIVYAEDVMIILFSQEYTNSSNYFRINLIFNFFSVIVFAPLFLATGKTRLYARVHMVLAFVIWITGYFVVYVFESPYAVVINSTLLNIIKVLVFVYLASKILDIKYLKFFPLKKIALSLIQSVVLITLVFILSNTILKVDSLILNVLITAILFGGLIILSSQLLGIDYSALYKPLITRLKDKFKE